MILLEVFPYYKVILYTEKITQYTVSGISPLSLDPTEVDPGSLNTLL